MESEAALERYELAHHQPLIGTLDTQALLEALPAAYRLEGMFFSPLVEMLGNEAWQRLLPQLEDPPARGRYVAFRDYSQRDYFVLTVAVAHARYPNLGEREGLRQLARADSATFSESTIGRVMLAMAGGAANALMRMPKAYEQVVRGQELRATRLDEHPVRIVALHDHSGWEYSLGQVEGVVLHYGATCTTKVEVFADRYAFDVAITPGVGG